MAYQRDILSADRVFFDTDVDLLPFRVYAGNPTALQLTAGDVVPVDCALWSFSFTVRLHEDSPDPALIEKFSASSPVGISVTGTFNADPTVNTQTVIVHLDDTDTYDPTGSSPQVKVDAGRYVYALKRIDDGFETIVAYGKFRLLRSAAWE